MPSKSGRLISGRSLPTRSLLLLPSLLAWCAVLHTQAARAQTQPQSPRVLEVEAGEARLACVDRAIVQRELLGADAETSLALTSIRAPDDAIAVRLSEGDTSLAVRVIEPSPGDCAALTAAVSLVARTLLEANPRPSTAQAQNVTQAVFARALLDPELSADGVEQAAPELPSSRWAGSAQLGTDGGLLGAWGATVSGGLTFRPSALELRADATAWLTPQQNRSGGTLDAWALAPRLWVCGARGQPGSLRIFACARAAVGALHVAAAGFAQSSERWLPFATVAPVLGLSFMNSFGFELALSSALNFMLLRSEFQLEVDPGNYRTLLGSSPISPGFELGLSKFF